jgi:tripartite-type tricarboxylate transporter receptor subunit TctC
VKAGKLKPIVIGARERNAALKDVPTTAEAGMPEIEAENWYGMVAPAATPPAVVARLNQIATEAMKSPEVIEKLASQGAILSPTTPEAFTAYIQSEIDKWGKVVQAAGVKVN